MAKIKTRDAVKSGVKAIDKAAVAGERMKREYIRTKAKAERSVYAAEETPEEYAGDHLEYAGEEIPREAAHRAASGTKSAVRHGKEALQKRRARKAEQREAELPPEEEPPAPEPDTDPEPQEQPQSSSTDAAPDAPERPQPQQADTGRTDQSTEQHPIQAESAQGRNTAYPEQPQAEPVSNQPPQADPPGVERPYTRQPIERRQRPDEPAQPPGTKAADGTNAEYVTEQGRDLAKRQARERAAEKSRRPADTSRKGTDTARRGAEHGADAAHHGVEVTRQSTERVSDTAHTTIKTIDRAHDSVKTLDRERRRAIKTAERIRKTAVRTGRATVKTGQRAAKTAERTSKAAIKTAEHTAKMAQKSAQAAAKAARATAQAAQAAAKATAAAAKAAAKAVAAAIKAIIAAVKGLAAAIAAGGWVAVAVIVLICMIGLIVGSCFGIFFAGEDSGTGQTIQTVVREINEDYQGQIDTIKAGTVYDELEMSGSRAVWKEVLAVYAVKTTTDPNSPREVASMDDTKKALLRDIFWQMNEISSSTATATGTEIQETDDGHGNIVETEVEVTKTTLYITVAHKTADEMADMYGFAAEQREQLAALLADENNSLWSFVLYGIGTGDGEIVVVALSQIGNIGGEPYWSWYGFTSRVEWCACFVSWCANECGYIDAGVIPKFAGCVGGVTWFQGRGLWQDNSYEPRPGDIIFFDWDNKGSSGPQDGSADHVGIVEKVENGSVYTVEGNSSDGCRERSYTIGHYEILGYGTPAY